MDCRRLPGDPRDAENFSWSEFLGEKPPARPSAKPWVYLTLVTWVALCVMTWRRTREQTAHERANTAHEKTERLLVSANDETLWQQRLDILRYVLRGHSALSEQVIRRLGSIACERGSRNGDPTLFATLFVLALWRRDGLLIDNSRPEVPREGFPETRKLLAQIDW